MSEPARGAAAPASVSSVVVEGHLCDCPDGLMVAPDCLGNAYLSAIGDVPVTILVPQPDPAQVESGNPLPQLISPPKHYSYPSSQQPAAHLASDPMHDWSSWGKIIAADREGWTVAALHRLAFRCDLTRPANDPQQVCEAIDSAVDDWWETLAVWLDTYTELDLLGYHGPSLQAIRSSVGLRAHTGEKAGAPAREVTWRSPSIRRTIKVPPLVRVPDSAVFERCVHLAGIGSTPPQAWTYLREARSWLRADQPRRAVIDACTGAEIALAHQVHQLLAGRTDRSIIDQLLGRCAGIAQVATVVRQNGGTTVSRKAVEVDLAKARNEAAHAGKAPDGDTARRAVEVAGQIVERVWPLATLGNLP